MRKRAAAAALGVLILFSGCGRTGKALQKASADSAEEMVSEAESFMNPGE